MIGPTAPDSAKITPKATGVSRATMAMPATAASPNSAMDRVTKAWPTGVASWVRIAGRAMRENGPEIAARPRARVG
jgi:hypothetical protein